MKDKPKAVIFYVYQNEKYKTQTRYINIYICTDSQAERMADNDDANENMQKKKRKEKKIQKQI